MWNKLGKPKPDKGNSPVTVPVNAFPISAGRLCISKISIILYRYMTKNSRLHRCYTCILYEKRVEFEQSFYPQWNIHK